MEKYIRSLNRKYITILFYVYSIFVLCSCYKTKPVPCKIVKELQYVKDTILVGEGQFNSCTREPVEEQYMYRSDGSIHSIDMNTEKNGNSIGIYFDRQNQLVFIEKTAKDSLEYTKIFNDSLYQVWKKNGGL